MLRRPSESLAVGLSLAGAALLGVPAFYYRIDRVDCPNWPPLPTGVLCGAVYLLAVALLTAGWLGMMRAGISRVLLPGLAVHLVALLWPPFLSQDPLFYAAVGRAMAAYHQGPHVPLRAALPLGDPILGALPSHWLDGTSAYFAGFNGLSWLVGLVGGDRLAVHLKLYQLVGLASMMATAALVGMAAGPRAAALVLFCPLAIIEGTVGAHNDGLLAVSAAFFALCLSRGRRGLALLALLPGLLVKASALLLLGLYVWHLLFSLLRRRLAVFFLGAAVMAVVAVIAVPVLHSYSTLLGSPADAVEHCTRSIECLPRVILHVVLHLPTAAWLVRLLFRVAGGLFILYAAYRSTEGRVLSWAAAGLLGYYLYLHGSSFSWYFLGLLPLLPFAGPRIYPAAATLCVSAVAYYVLSLPFNCLADGAAGLLEHVAEATILLLPPTFVLLRSRDA